MEDLSNYEKLREDAQKFYKGIGKIFSPAINQEIYFPAESFNHIVFKDNLDIYFQNIEYIIFRCQPSVRLTDKFSPLFVIPPIILNELSYFFYFSYYLLIPVLGIILYRKNLQEFLHFIFGVSFTFYFCYLIYPTLLLPDGHSCFSRLKLSPGPDRLNP